MIAVTSISPKNIDRQKVAIESWLKLGLDVYSVNSIQEINLLKNIFQDVIFFEAKQTGLSEFGKPYIRLNEFKVFVQHFGKCLLINSDCIIYKEFELPNKNELLFFSRYDCINYNYSRAEKFISGYDAFYLTTELANLLPDTKLCLGQCHWDYWLPMVMINNNIKLVTPKEPIIFHEIHPVQYSTELWTKTANIFGKELGIEGAPNQISKTAYNLIKSKINYR